MTFVRCRTVAKVDSPGVPLSSAFQISLRRRDVDLDARTLRVAQTVQRVGGELAFSEPKTTRSRRTVPLPPVTLTGCVPNGPRRLPPTRTELAAAEHARQRQLAEACAAAAAPLLDPDRGDPLADMFDTTDAEKNPS